MQPATLPGWKDRRPAVTTPISSIGVGDVLGGTYRLTRPIQRGGMGEVFLATHERLPMEFAVKVLSPSLFDADGFAQFRQEAAVLARLRHPNIVQLVDFNWTQGGLPYLVMEHLPGTDLGQVLANDPRLTSDQILSIVYQAACGLHAAHRAGIAHLDLKPSNMMVVPYEGHDDLIKLIDFGISMVGQPLDGGIAGTPEFMSPEQVEGCPDEIGAASDQFTLAVIAYLLFAGTVPWRGEDADLAEAIASGPPAPLPLEEEHAAVEAVLQRALAKLPGQRFSSTLAFAQAFRSAMRRDGLLAEAGDDAGLAEPEAAAVPQAARAAHDSPAVTVRLRRPARHTAAAPHPHPHRRAGILLVIAALAAALSLLSPPTRDQATEACSIARGYATRAAHTFLDEGRSLLSAARRAPRP